MQDVFPVNFDYVKGEQPTGTKMTGGVKQADTAFSRVTKAIGDPWEYQVHTGGPSDTAYNLSPERLAQASLARFMGPSDYVSPRGASFQEPQTTGFEVRLNNYQNSWCLGMPLVKLSSDLAPSDSGTGKVVTLTWGTDITVVSDASGVLAGTPKGDIEDLEVHGDFHVDYYKGVITSYSRPTAVIELEIANAHVMGPGAPWSTHNVIPTWQETVALCNIKEVGSPSGGLSTYTITLPEVSAAPRRSSGSSMYGAPEEYETTRVQIYATTFGEGAKYRLPYALTSVLAADDEIPEGFMHLWDNNAGRMLPSVTFYYIDEYSVKAVTSAGWLTEGDTARLILTGSSMAETVNYLATVVRESRRTGLHQGQHVDTMHYSMPLSHDHLTNLFTGDIPSAIADPERYYFRASDYPTNPHPQYLHRAGYMADDVNGNSGNAMRGDLVFTRSTTFELGSGSSYASSVTGLATTTPAIRFGGAGTHVYFNHPSIQWIGGKDISSWSHPGTYSKDDGIAHRVGFGIRALGANPKPRDYEYGALAITSYDTAPSLYLRTRKGEGYLDFTGAYIGFDLGRQMELNYIKLLAGIRSTDSDGSDKANQPANTGQSTWGTPHSITPSLSNSLSVEQLREWRFRGGARCWTATNNGLGAVSTEFEKYFTSPGIVGADFFNVYSNAIFFSEQGDGKFTSLHDRGAGWFDNPSNDQPAGLYYEPDNSRYKFVTYSGGSPQTPAIFGDDITLACGGTAGLSGTTSASITSAGSVIVWSLASSTNVAAGKEITLTAYGNEAAPAADDDTIRIRKNVATSFTEMYHKSDTTGLLIRTYDASNVQQAAISMDPATGILGIIAQNTVTIEGTSASIRLNGNAVYSGAILATTPGSGTRIAIDGFGQLKPWSSSRRYKNNIQAMQDSSWLYDLKPVSFSFKSQPDAAQFGFIAEDLAEICPELVVNNSDGEPESINPDSILAAAVNEIKQLRNEIRELKKQY
jgi:hypothetical protein